MTRSPWAARTETGELHFQTNLSLNMLDNSRMFKAPLRETRVALETQTEGKDELSFLRFPCRSLAALCGLAGDPGELFFYVFFTSCSATNKKNKTYLHRNATWPCANATRRILPWNTNSPEQRASVWNSAASSTVRFWVMMRLLYRVNHDTLFCTRSTGPVKEGVYSI